MEQVIFTTTCLYRRQKTHKFNMRSTYWERMDTAARSAAFWRDVIIEIIATTFLLIAQCILPLSWGHEIYHGSLVQVRLLKELEILHRNFLKIAQTKNRRLCRVFLNFPGFIYPLLNLVLPATITFVIVMII